MNNASKRQARYDADHTRQIHLKLNTTTDKDIIEYLETQDNIQGTIKTAIRDQIAKAKSPQK